MNKVIDLKAGEVLGVYSPVRLNQINRVVGSYVYDFIINKKKNVVIYSDKIGAQYIEAILTARVAYEKYRAKVESKETLDYLSGGLALLTVLEKKSISKANKVLKSSKVGKLIVKHLKEYVEKEDQDIDVVILLDNTWIASFTPSIQSTGKIGILVDNTYYDRNPELLKPELAKLTDHSEILVNTGARINKSTLHYYKEKDELREFRYIVTGDELHWNCILLEAEKEGKLL